MKIYPKILTVLLTAVAVTGAGFAAAAFLKKTWPPELQSVVDLYLFPLFVLLVSGFAVILIWQAVRSAK